MVLVAATIVQAASRVVIAATDRPNSQLWIGSNSAKAEDVEETPAYLKEEEEASTAQEASFTDLSRLLFRKSTRRLRWKGFATGWGIF